MDCYPIYFLSPTSLTTHHHLVRSAPVRRPRFRVYCWRQHYSDHCLFQFCLPHLLSMQEYIYGIKNRGHGLVWFCIAPSPSVLTSTFYLLLTNVYCLFIVKYPLGTQRGKWQSYNRIQKENEESPEKGRTGKTKRPTEDGFTVLFEANVQIRTPRFKHKSKWQRQTELQLVSFLSWVSSLLYKW